MHRGYRADRTDDQRPPVGARLARDRHDECMDVYATTGRAQARSYKGYPPSLMLWIPAP
ncbi:hypothetical protein GCM10009552_25770 [Rothia nasimurium]